MRWYAVALVLLAASTIACREPKVEASDPAQSPPVLLLRDYLRLDTSNPPGFETRGAEWLAARLREGGLEPRLIGNDPDRQSVYARLESGSDLPALLLMHHIDVVPADAGLWSVDPFGGEVRNGYVYGRGAIDAKSLGIAHLLAAIDLASSVEPLTRDLVFLGVAGEETGGETGLAELLEQHPDLFADVGFVLNEGGFNQVVVDEVIFWGIEIDQKVPLWVELVATGRGGHGAGINDDSSVMRLLRVLHEVALMETPRKVTPAVSAYFRAVAPVTRGRKSRVLAEIERYVGSPRLDEYLPAGYLGLLRDTWTISVLDAGKQVNVVPARASAQIDIRLLPGSDPGDALARLVEIAGEHGVEVEVLLEGESAEPAPIATELWDVLREELSAEEPDAVVGPMVAMGTTDSRFFRQRGVVAYGFSPFKINFYDGATVHGEDERIRVLFLLEGVELMKRIVRSACAG